MKYCQECGSKLKVAGTKPWQTFLECVGRGHKYEISHGDVVGGSSDSTSQIKAFPKDMRPTEESR